MQTDRIAILEKSGDGNYYCNYCGKIVGRAEIKKCPSCDAIFRREALLSAEQVYQLKNFLMR